MVLGGEPPGRVGRRRNYSRRSRRAHACAAGAPFPRSRARKLPLQTGTTLAGRYPRSPGVRAERLHVASHLGTAVTIDQRCDHAAGTEHGGSVMAEGRRTGGSGSARGGPRGGGRPAGAGKGGAGKGGAGKGGAEAVREGRRQERRSRRVREGRRPQWWRPEGRRAGRSGEAVRSQRRELGQAGCTRQRQARGAGCGYREACGSERRVRREPGGECTDRRFAYREQRAARSGEWRTPRRISGWVRAFRSARRARWRPFGERSPSQRRS